MQYIVSYFTEKGKNLATKEDIKDITDKVESVKASYNESLERHKIELQREFELDKYRMKLCSSIDNDLIELISCALQTYHSKGIEYPESDDRELIESAYKISNHLSSYYSRYINIKQLDKLRDVSIEIKLQAQLDCAPIMRESHKRDYISALSSAIALFLPKLK